jgi:hypothetical protein
MYWILRRNIHLSLMGWKKAVMYSVINIQYKAYIDFFNIEQTSKINID